MIKMISLIKRKPGTSLEEFKVYYETRHKEFARGYLREAVRYIRHYVTCRPDPDTGEVSEPEYDVVTEIWVPDEESYERMMQRLRTPEARIAFVDDESKVFDRGSIKRYVVVDEREDDPSLDHYRASTLGGT